MKKIAIVLLLLLALPFVISEQGDGNSNGNGNGNQLDNNQLVGNDANENGCIGSAGYSWCREKGKCLRNWEESCTSGEDETETGEGNGNICTQAITYAVNAENKCRKFATPCKVPTGWQAVQSCEGYATTRSVKEIKEQIKERAHERVQEVKDDLNQLRKKVKERMDEEGRPFQAVVEMSEGQETQAGEGFFIKLLSVDSNCNSDENDLLGNCPAVRSSAAFSIYSADSNFSEEFVLEGNSRKNIGGLSIKLLTTKEGSARVQILPIKGVLPPSFGAGMITMFPNIGRIAKEIDDEIEDSNMLEDLNSLEGADIKNLIIGHMRKEIKAEIRSDGRRILKAIPSLAMQSIKARIRSMNGFSDLNIVQEDSNWVIQTPKGNEIPIKWDVEVDGNSLYIMTPKMKKKLTVLPEEASEIAQQRANMFAIKAVRIETENGEPVYRLQGKQTGKLFGLFTTEFGVTADMDIESGNVKNLKKPWWSFLVFGK